MNPHDDEQIEQKPLDHMCGWKLQEYQDVIVTYHKGLGNKIFYVAITGGAKHYAMKVEEGVMTMSELPTSFQFPKTFIRLDDDLKKQVARTMLLWKILEEMNMTPAEENHYVIIEQSLIYVRKAINNIIKFKMLEDLVPLM